MENNEQPELPLDTRKMRESKVLGADIAGIREPNRAPKNFATNQGVRGFTMQEITKSELAISHAMTEVYARFNSQLIEASAKFEALTQCFEECTRIHSNMITQLESRVNFLEARWWERLMRDFEWDWYGIVDWIHHKFPWTARDTYVVEVEAPEDPAILVLEDHLSPPDMEDYPDSVDEAPAPLTLMPDTPHDMGDAQKE